MRPVGNTAVHSCEISVIQTFAKLGCPMEFFRLMVFEAVWRCRSYTKAAKELGITQPAVSQNISELEKELGTELFRREEPRGKMLPTSAAKFFRKYVLRILKNCDDVGTVFNPGIAASYNKVSVKASRTASEQILPQLVETLKAIYPSLEVEVRPEEAETSPDTKPVGADPEKEPADVCISTSGIVGNGALELTFDVSGTHPLVPAVRLILDELLDRSE